MWFLYIWGLVTALLIDYLVSKQFADIAEMKGHEGRTYFWFTFLFGVVGMLMVVALPDYSTIKATRLSPLSAKPADVFNKATAHTQNNTAKRCPYCGDVVKLDRCEMCGKEVR